MSLRSHFLVGAVLLAGLLLGGCTVRPLYGTTSGEAGPQADLPAIDVQEPDSRTEQAFRNALLFALRGGGDGTDSRYGLVYRMTVHEQALAVERKTGTPNVHQLTGGVSFLLKEIATGDSLFGASVTSIDTYSRSSQNFANMRARIDAEDRLAQALAELTQARLAAYFATH